MRVTRGDTLRVFDTALWRVSVFSPSGDLVRTNSFVRPPEFGQIPEAQIDPECRIYHLSYQDFATTALSDLGNRRAGIVRGRTNIAV